MTSPISPPATVNPTPTPTPSPTPVLATLSIVTIDKTSLTVGESLTLSTAVSDGTPNLPVAFYDQNNLAVGTDLTDSSGIATVTIQPPIGTWTYYATATHP